MRFPCFLIVLLVVSGAEAFELRSIGFKAGIGNVGTDMQFEGASLFDPDSEWVANGGVFAQWRRGPRARFDVLTEAWWLRPGFERGGELQQAEILAFPILLRSAVNRNDPELYVYFGPSFEFVLSTDDDPILNQYKSFALAGQAGMGVEKRLNKHLTALAEFRFSAELTNIFDKPDGDSLESVTHRWLQFSGGMRF